MSVETINSVNNVQLSKIQAQKPAFGQNVPPKQESEDKTGLIVAGLAAAAAIGVAAVMIAKGKGNKAVNTAKEAAETVANNNEVVDNSAKYMEEAKKRIAKKKEIASARAAETKRIKQEHRIGSGNTKSAKDSAEAMQEAWASRSYGELTRIEALEKRVMVIGTDGKPTFDALQAQKMLKVNELSEEGATKLLKTIIPEEEHEYLQFLLERVKDPLWKECDMSVSEYIMQVRQNRAFVKKMFGDDYFKIFKKDFPLLNDKKFGELTVGDIKDAFPEKLFNELIPSGITDRSQKLVDIETNFRKFDLNKTLLEQLP